MSESEFLDMLLGSQRARSVLSRLSTAYGMSSGLAMKASRVQAATGHRHFVVDRDQAELFIRSLVYELEESKLGSMPFLRKALGMKVEDWPRYLYALDNRSGQSVPLIQELLAVSGSLVLGQVDE